MSKYKNFLNSLEESIQSTNRDPQDIELIAVSKKKSATDIQIVIDQGHLSFGENQIQEINWPIFRDFARHHESCFCSPIPWMDCRP